MSCPTSWRCQLFGSASGAPPAEHGLWTFGRIGARLTRGQVTELYRREKWERAIEQNRP